VYGHRNSLQAVGAAEATLLLTKRIRKALAQAKKSAAGANWQNMRQMKLFIVSSGDWSYERRRILGIVERGVREQIAAVIIPG